MFRPRTDAGRRKRRKSRLFRVRSEQHWGMRTPIFNAVNLSEEGERGYTLMNGVYPSVGHELR